MITACILAHNEESHIAKTIDSVKNHVSEILVIDDNSTDSTRIIAERAGARVERLPFTVANKGFAEAANWMTFQAKEEWIFIIDADELVTNPEKLHSLMRSPEKEVWALPRRKWWKYPDIRIEYESYPDWQIRFFKNNPSFTFKGQMHVRFSGGQVYYAYNGPFIEHKQNELRTPSKKIHRDNLYRVLATRQGVHIHGGKEVIKK